MTAGSTTRTRRRVVVDAARLGLAAGLGMATRPSAAADPQQWQSYTFWGSPNVVAARAFRKLVEDIEAASNGALKIKFNLGGSLSIAAPNINAAVGDDIVQIADDAYFQGTIPAAVLLAMPFLTQSIAEMKTVVGIMRPEIEAAYGKRGVTALGSYIYPAQVFWSRGEIGSLADIRGKKYRVSSAEQGEFLKSIGATPVTIGSADVPSALERGLVDGILTASAGGVLAWKDLLKSSYRLEVNYPVAWIIVNTERFGKLSPELRTAIQGLADKSLPALTDALQSDEIELTKTFGSQGIRMVSANPADPGEARAKMEPIWASLANARGPEVVKLLERIRSTLGR